MTNRISYILSIFIAITVGVFIGGLATVIIFLLFFTPKMPSAI